MIGNYFFFKRDDNKKMKKNASFFLGKRTGANLFSLPENRCFSKFLCHFNVNTWFLNFAFSDNPVGEYIAIVIIGKCHVPVRTFLRASYRMRTCFIGITVAGTVKKGKKRISVLPASEVKDSNGQVIFSIKQSQNEDR